MIHPLALVHPDCEVGKGSQVWQFASVIRRARLGVGSSVAACAIVDGSRIGDRARIGHGAQIHPGVVAGDSLFMGPASVLCNDMWPWMDPTEFDIDALIEGRNVAVIIEDGVTIGAGAIILPGTRLCAGSVVAAGAVAQGAVPANHLLHRDGSVRPLSERRDRMRFAA